MLEAFPNRCVSVPPGPDYIRQKYNEPVEVKETPVEDKNNKSPTGSPHFYRKGTTPTQSPSGSPCPSPSASPTTVKNTFNKTPASAAAPPKEIKTALAESLAAGTELLLVTPSSEGGLTPPSLCVVSSPLHH